MNQDVQRPLRLLEVVASSLGGGATHVRDLSLGLAQHGHRVAVVMPDDGGNVRREEFAAAGIACHDLPLAGSVAPAAWLALRRLLRDVDLAHAHGARAAFHLRLAAATLPRRRRPRLVYTIHGYVAPHYRPVRRALLMAIERLLWPWTDRCIAVSLSERAKYIDHGPGRPARMAVIYHGIDVERFAAPGLDADALLALRRELGLSPGHHVLLAVSRLFTPRDLGTLLAALAQVAPEQPELRLLVAGDGPDRPQIEAAIRDLGLSERVILAGVRRDVPALLALAEIAVLCTTPGEGMPLVIMEAMAAGRPVIATAVDGVPEEIDDGLTGLLVPPGDVAAWAAALRTLLADPMRGSAMGARGREVARERFCLARMVSETEALYRQVMEA